VIILGGAANGDCGRGTRVARAAASALDAVRALFRAGTRHAL